MARSVEKIMNDHNDAVRRGNLDEVMADYCADSFMVTPTGVIKGLDAIRKHFDNTINNVLTPDVKSEILLLITEGDVGYAIWRAEGDKFALPFATDTFVMRDDKILVQTFASVPPQKK